MEHLRDGCFAFRFLSFEKGEASIHTYSEAAWRQSSIMYYVDQVWLWERLGDKITK